MLEKLTSARFLATVMVTATVCIVTIAIVTKCFLNPDAFDKLKELVMALIVAFTGTLSTIINAYFNRSDRNEPKGGTNVG